MSALGAKTLGFKNILIAAIECFYLDIEKIIFVIKFTLKKN